MESPKGNFDADLKETCMDTIFGYHAQIVQQDWSDFVVKQNLWFKALNFLFRIVLVILKKEKKTHKFTDYRTIWVFGHEVFSLALKTYQQFSNV